MTTRRHRRGGINVNGIPHQHADVGGHARAQQEPYYIEPYQQVPRTPQDVLIVGAGTGTDVAIALAQGVDARRRGRDRPDAAAVRRDSTIPTRPTRIRGSPPTSTTAARSCNSTDQKYDLILFALPDSLTLVSGASSLRLESYLFT